MRTVRGIHHSAPAMPSTRPGFEVAPSRRDGRSTPAGAPFGLRLRVFTTRARLDRQIAAGTPCEASEALTLRTRQLTDSRVRRDIAGNLRRLIEYVDRREPRAIVSAVVVESQAVREGRDAIMELAELLEEGAPVSPRGVVLARRFLTDGLSPLFNPSSRRTVTQAVREIQDALEELPATGFDALAA